MVRRKMVALRKFVAHALGEMQWPPDPEKRVPQDSRSEACSGHAQSTLNPRSEVKMVALRKFVAHGSEHFPPFVDLTFSRRKRGKGGRGENVRGRVPQSFIAQLSDLEGD